MSDNVAASRDLLGALDDKQLSQLCAADFDPVCDHFVDGMGRRWKSQYLLDYCRRQGQLDRLLARIREINRTLYSEVRPSPEKSSTATEATAGLSIEQSRLAIVYHARFPHLTPELLFAATGALAAALELDRYQIRVRRLEKSPLAVHVSLPSKAAERLVALRKDSPVVMVELGIQQIREVAEHIPSRLSSVQRDKLLRVFDESFSEEELKTLCFTLGEKYDNLPAAGAVNKARELIDKLERRGRIGHLFEVGEQQRPDIAWDETLQTAADSPFARHKTSAPFSVRYGRNPDFVGRTEELALLHLALAIEGAGHSRPVGLTGMAGVGKTRLAVEYAYQGREEALYPEGIFWINMAESLQHELAEIGKDLNPELASHPVEEQSQHALAYLRKSPQALLVLDNLADLAILKQSVGSSPGPAELPCHVLFTTRRRTGHYPTRDITVLPEKMAIALLLRYAGRAISPGTEEYEAARMICRMLGALPLALEIAGAFLSEWPDIPLVEFQQRLHEDGGLEVLEFEAELLPPEKLSAIHEGAMAVTLENQWQELTDEVARKLLRVAGQFPEAAAIPVGRLGLLAGVPAESGRGRPSHLERALRQLQRASLVQPLAEDQIRLHPLVHDFAAQLAPAAGQDAFRLELVANLAQMVKNPEHVSTRAITAGECLLDPPWPMERARSPVLEALHRVVSNEALSVPQRRRAAFLLLHLDWLQDSQDVSAEEALTFLELLLRMVDSSAQLRSLAGYIADLLTSELSSRQHAQLLVYQVQISMRLYERLSGASRRSQSGKPRLESAKARLDQAEQQMHPLNEPEHYALGAQDHKLQASFYFTSGNVFSIEAEMAGDQDVRDKKLRRAVEMYSNAIPSALAYREDAVLLASIYIELSYAHYLLQDEEEAERYNREAREVLHASSEKSQDPELYAKYYSIALNAAGVMHVERGDSLIESDVIQARSEYEAAYDLAKQEIEIVEKLLPESAALVFALANAGIYASKVYECSQMSAQHLLEEACNYWQQAATWAPRLGLWHIRKGVDDYLKEYCSSIGA